MKITKIDTVQRNMDFAIEAYFSEKDIVPIWTIVGAAHNVAHDLIKEKKRKEAVADLCANANGTTISEILSSFRKTPNWLKHANRDAQSTLEIDNSDLEHTMLFTTLDLGNLLVKSTKHSNEILVFQLWYIAKYQKTFDSPQYSNLVMAANKEFPNLNNKSQTMQLKAGYKKLKNTA